MTLHILGMKLKQDPFWAKTPEGPTRIWWVCCKSAKSCVCWHEEEVVMRRRWRLDLMSDAEIPHLVSSRLIMLILTFYRLPLFLISGAGTFLSFSSLTLFVFTAWLHPASRGLSPRSREDCWDAGDDRSRRGGERRGEAKAASVRQESNTKLIPF